MGRTLQSTRKIPGKSRENPGEFLTKSRDSFLHFPGSPIVFPLDWELRGVRRTRCTRGIVGRWGPANPAGPSGTWWDPRIPQGTTKTGDLLGKLLGDALKVFLFPPGKLEFSFFPYFSEKIAKTP